MTFSLFRIPIRVQGFFLAFAAFVAISAGFKDPASLFIFVAVIFASVLAHELGHAFAGRAFGLDPAITLHPMGGITTWTRGRRLDGGRNLVISIAGPAVGFLLGLMLLVIGRWVLPAIAPTYQAPEVAASLFKATIAINIVWSIFNLFPVMPLDGGNALYAFWSLTKIGDAEIVARVVSVAVGGLSAVGLFFIHWYWAAALMFGYTIQNVNGLRARAATRSDDVVRRELEVAFPVWLSEKDSDAMLREGTRARAAAKTPGLVAYATEIVAMGQCLQGDARSALATLGSIPQGYAPSLDVALHVLDAAGEHAAALDLLRRAAESSRDPELMRRFEEARARMS